MMKMEYEDRRRFDAFINGLILLFGESLMIEEIITERVWLLSWTNPDSDEKAMVKLVYLAEKPYKERFKLFPIIQ